MTVNEANLKQFTLCHSHGLNLHITEGKQAQQKRGTGRGGLAG